MAELLRMRWEESDVRFGTVKLYSSKTKKWRTIKAPSAATLIANRRAAGQGGTTRVLTHPDHWYRDILGPFGSLVLEFVMARESQADGPPTIFATPA